MKMLPDNMERRGAAGVFKEAARLLHNHARLLLPFYLAFQLPAAVLSIFQTVFLVPAPHKYTSFVKAAAAYQVTLAGSDGEQPSLILTYTVSLLVFILSTLAVTAFTYTVQYIYTAPEDDDAIAETVFKQLPHALFRTVVTELWMFLVLVLLNVACVVGAFVLNAVVAAVIGGPSGPTPAFFLFMTVLYVIGMTVAGIMFALAQFVAVLEPEKYGRAALEQSSKYARGRAGTIFCVVELGVAIELLVTYVPAQAVATAGMALWVKILVAGVLSIWTSVVGVYVGLAGVVMYFVCKSDVEGVLPEFQRGSNGIPAADSPYEPLVQGSAPGA